MENFILQQYIQDISLCDKLIDYHKQNTEFKRPGYSHDVVTKKSIINKDVKDSIDVGFFNTSNNPTIQNYFSELDIIVKKYVTKYKIHSDFKTCFGNNLQYYEPGGGYKVWHNERDEFGSSHDLICSRGLVYMTFLNTVTDGGGTEFYWQNLKINFLKGLTLIWPTDFTHTHRGIISPTQEKYIATGWYRYL